LPEQFEGLGGTNASWAVIRWIAQSSVGFSSRFVRFKAFPEKVRAFAIPAPCCLFIRLVGAALPVRKPLCDAAHKCAQFGVGLLRLSMECCGSSPALPGQHGAKAKPIKENVFNDSYGAASVVFAKVVLLSRLRDLDEPGFLQEVNGSFNPALADSSSFHNGGHVHVDEAMLQGRGAKAKGGQVKMGQDAFNDDLKSFPALTSDFATRAVKGLAFGWMFIPCLCPLGGKREDTRQAAFAFPDGFGRGKFGVLRVMAAPIAGHISTPRG